MNKSIANIFLAITISISLSTFALAADPWDEYRNVLINSGLHLWESDPSLHKCLDIANGQTTEGTPIVQFTCHGGPNQRFSILPEYSVGGLPTGNHRIQSDLNPNMCVGIQNVSYGNSGEPLRLVPCRLRNGVTQPRALWQLDNTIIPRIMAKMLSSDGKRTCIDVPSGTTINGMQMQIFYCNNQTTAVNQSWYFSPKVF